MDQNEDPLFVEPLLYCISLKSSPRRCQPQPVIHKINTDMGFPSQNNHVVVSATTIELRSIE
jgi:hypothetical protein